MAGALNKVQLIGHLGRDPELKTNGDGNARAMLSLATSERWADKESGEKRERTEWHRVVIWNTKLAELAQKYLAKGSLVYVEGELRTRKWTDRSNVDRWTTEVNVTQFNGEVVFLSSAPGSEGEASVSAPLVPTTRPSTDEEIPF
jgi:single-strand DNA-binding protein